MRLFRPVYLLTILLFVFSMFLPNTASAVITSTLSFGMSSPEVRELQAFLNSRGFTVSSYGAGSVGNETTYFGNATRNAVTRFQEAYRNETYVPAGLQRAPGLVGAYTRQTINRIMAAGQLGQNRFAPAGEIPITPPIVDPGVVDFQEPTVPLWLRWGDITDTIIVTGWAVSTDNVGVTGYKIYKSSGLSEPVYYRTTTGNTYTFTELIPDTIYNFKVSAIDAAGNESDKVGLSISTSARRENDVPIVDSVSPSIPSWLRWGDIDANRVVTGWPVSTDNVGVTGYKIYRSISPAQLTYITTVTGTSYVHTNLLADTLYSFAVSAIDAAGNESDKVGLSISTGQDLGSGINNNPTPSNSVSDVNPPSIPIRVGWGDITSSTIFIGWPASSDDVAVTGYKIYRSVYPDEPVYLTTVTGTSYTNTGLMANTIYSFKVSAIDAAGNESDKVGLVISTNP